MGARIISFEGSDCAGKTTLAKSVATQLSPSFNIRYNNGVIYPCDFSKHLEELAKEANDLQREALYTMTFVSDSIMDKESTEDLIFCQDRYWTSVVAYGSYLNGEDSMHHNKDYRTRFIEPVATVYLTCTYEERLKRFQSRSKKSVLDRIILDKTSLSRLDHHISKALCGLPNRINIDTTNQTIPESENAIIRELQARGILK